MVRSSNIASGPQHGRHRLHVVAPYRLDLTVTALRRLPNNLVDVFTADGRYLRAFPGPAQPVVACVTQTGRQSLSIQVSADTREVPATIRHMLGVDCDLSDFNERARRISWLAPLVARMAGAKPPRYPTIWEAAVNAIVFQQISLSAATSIVRRLVTALGDGAVWDSVPLVVFPSPDRLLSASDVSLRSLGLSGSKVMTLRRAAEAVATGELTNAMLEPLASDDAMLLLRRIKGIGPWTAAVTLLRGLARLDVFPANDSGVAASLAEVARRRINPISVARRLGPQRGMLYFYLLLGRLEKRGQIGCVSDVARG